MFLCSEERAHYEGQAEVIGKGVIATKCPTRKG